MRIPGYKVHKLIAEGGMSSVYLALQQSLGRRVAIKLMKRFGDAEQAAHFTHEARTIAALQHQNIITIYDVGAVGERYYIAMEYLEGGSLLERIRQGIPPETAIELLERLAGCLDFVHRKGVVHGDVKPSNILFHADGTPKLTDFGIARPVDDGAAEAPSGRAFGSPFYISPEQAEGRALDGRTDIYALGIVFYETLTGRQPFRAESQLETIVAHLSDPIPMLPEALAAYQGLLEGMLAKRPQERIATAADLVDTIRRLRATTAPSRHRKRPALRRGAGLAARPGRRWRQPPARWKAALAGGLAALVLGALWFPGDSETGAVAQTDPTPKAGPERPRQTAPTAVSMAATVSGAASRAHGARTASATAPATKVAAARPPTPDPTPATQARAAVADPVSQIVLPAATPALAIRSAEPAAPVAAAEAPGTPAIDQPAPDRVAIADRMQAGDRALAALRLTTPVDDNALLHYSRVLQMDPQHAGAANGIERIAASYAALARRARQKGDSARARVYLGRGLKVDPDHSGLVSLRAQLDQAEQIAVAPQVAPVVMPPPAPPEPRTVSLRGREGSGNIVKDFVNVWHSIFD